MQPELKSNEEEVILMIIGQKKEEFSRLIDLFPERARELDEILPSPLVLRTHQKGTWIVEKLGIVEFAYDLFEQFYILLMVIFYF